MQKWKLCSTLLKMPGLISQKFSTEYPKISWFQISFKSFKPFGHKTVLDLGEKKIVDAHVHANLKSYSNDKSFL